MPIHPCNDDFLNKFQLTDANVSDSLVAIEATYPSTKRLLEIPKIGACLEQITHAKPVAAEPLGAIHFRENILVL